ncbi:hypothetical protein [Streptomyces sp. NPDC057910]|uniref:hypothetical protein n=1 Tax=Streptomyces sp. NPDC057910 TaxID=3346278 RepID=UPI0036E09633
MDNNFYANTQELQQERRTSGPIVLKSLRPGHLEKLRHSGELDVFEKSTFALLKDQREDIETSSPGHDRRHYRARFGDQCQRGAFCAQCENFHHAGQWFCAPAHVVPS